MDEGCSDVDVNLGLLLLGRGGRGGREGLTRLKLCRGGDGFVVILVLHVNLETELSESCEGQTHTYRERQRETDRQTERQTDRDRQRERDEEFLALRFSVWHYANESVILVWVIF